MIKRLDDVSSLLVARQKQNGDVPRGVSFLQLCANLKSVHARHFDVQQDHVRRRRLGNPDPLATRICVQHLRHDSVKIVVSQVMSIWIVIDHQ